MIRIGTAGWSIPKKYAHLFPSEGTHLERYSRRFSVTEINQTFYKLPRASTLQKWADSTPDSFRFTLKLHRSFTHFHKLSSTEGLKKFIETVYHLGEKLFAILVQLPPSLKYDEERADQFFATLRQLFDRPLALESRDASWLEAGPLLHKYQITQVAVDPSRFEGDSEPGGFQEVIYYRLHGSPKIYYSEYTKEYLENFAQKLRSHQAKEKIVIFDNTAGGAAIKNALELMEMIGEAQ